MGSFSPRKARQNVFAAAVFGFNTSLLGVVAVEQGNPILGLAAASFLIGAGVLVKQAGHPPESDAEPPAPDPEPHSGIPEQRGHGRRRPGHRRR